MSVLPYSKENIIKIIQSLKEGGVVSFPTETVYALACNATNNKAISRIHEIKKRDQNKPLSLLIHDVEQVEDFVYIDQKIKNIIEKFSPGPLTYVLEAKKNSRVETLVKNNFLGFRIPDHETALQILKGSDFPIVATSVNLSGEEAATSVDKINIKDSIDQILDGGKSDIGISSTVVKISRDYTVTLLRKGSIEKEEIEKTLNL